jgi:glycosyltransferase involved in cell wall biosynthesis
MSHIVYLSSARLPTEKAHGFATMKMCEAMGALGHDVELLHPWRRQSEPALVDMDPFDYYGVERTFRVHTLSNWDVVRLAERLPDLPFRVLFAAHEAGWGLLAARRARQRNPDLVYTRSAAFAYWATRLGQPCAFEAHLPATTGTAARYIRGVSKRPSLRAVFPLTTHTAAELEAQGIPRERITVLPTAVDLDAFADSPEREDARQRLGLPPRRPIVAYIGRFETMGKEKGIRDLIRAMRESELRRLDPLLLCVGGPMEAVGDYMELAATIGIPGSALRFVDRVPPKEMPTWLAAVDVAAMPYPAAEHYPTAMSPLKLFEYMAAGLPIVATDLPAIREVLEDGVNGLLVPPEKPEALASSLARILDDVDVARALGARARRDAAGYTWQRRAELALTCALDG